MRTTLTDQTYKFHIRRDHDTPMCILTTHRTKQPWFNAFAQKKKVLQDSVFLGKRHQSRISCKVQSFKAGFPIITIVKGFPPCINSPCAAKIPTEQSNLLETTKIVYYQLIRTFLLDLVDQLYYFRQ